MVSGVGSIPAQWALSLALFLLLAVLASVKNRLLATAREPDLNRSAQEDKVMGKAKIVCKTYFASIVEVVIALGTKLLAEVGLLAKLHSPKRFFQTVQIW